MDPLLVGGIGLRQRRHVPSRGETKISLNARPGFLSVEFCPDLFFQSFCDEEIFFAAISWPGPRGIPKFLARIPTVVVILHRFVRHAWHRIVR